MFVISLNAGGQIVRKTEWSHCKTTD